MSKSNAILSALVAAAGASLSQPVLAHTVDEKLGKVHFETSCTSAAGAAFDQGMLYQHSFWYSASQRAFNEALKADPECGIAYWGIALALLWNPHVAPPAKNLAEGAAIIAKGQRSAPRPSGNATISTALSANVRRLRKGRSPHARAELREGDGTARGEVSERRRGADLLRALAQCQLLRRPTRPMPISSRARRSSRRSATRQPDHPASRIT